MYSRVERTMETMEKLESLCRETFEHGPDGCLIFEKGRCVFYSPNYRRIVRYRQDEPLGPEATALKELLHPEDRDRVLDTFETAVRRRSPYASYAFRGRVRDGGYRWREDSARFIYDEQGQHIKTLVAARDIERRLQDPFFLPKAVPEREASRELHHRVKNDLELVRALLAIQAGKTETDIAREAIIDAADRIASLVHLYETLHRSGEYRDVTATELLAVLVPSLQEKATSQAVTITGDAEPSTVIPVNLARTTSLVINELTTNALKHGHQGAEHLRVEIRLEQEAGRLNIIVRDSGPGYPRSVLRGGASGFGLEIVQSMALQHGGFLELENDSGALARFTLPMK